MTAKSAPAPDPPQRFATDVVRRLREAGYEAVWAGGCVRDRLLGLVPKDYDVATSAPPDDVRRIFGHRRTLAMGAAFGVIAVLGPKRAGTVEVATFRADAAYSDGRHPDSVSFSTAEQDALRRDFTINGLFYDPLTDRVIDYVGGRQDLHDGLVRAIGDPHQRFGEDRLRMLRAVRFAASFRFRLDAATLAAIEQQADSLSIVSAERVAAEMRGMLCHRQRAVALDLLRRSRLLGVVLPELALIERRPDLEPQWQLTLTTLTELLSDDFATALAATLVDWSEAEPRSLASRLADRWRLARHERDDLGWLLTHLPTAITAQRQPWPRLQRLLVDPRAQRLVELARAYLLAHHQELAAVHFCADRLKWPEQRLDPPPLITGEDLLELKIPRGPQYQRLLNQVRDAQLEGHVTTRGQGRELAWRLWQQWQAESRE